MLAVLVGAQVPGQEADRLGDIAAEQIDNLGFFRGVTLVIARDLELRQALAAGINRIPAAVAGQEPFMQGFQGLKRADQGLLGLVAAMMVSHQADRAAKKLLQFRHNRHRPVQAQLELGQDGARVRAGRKVSGCAAQVLEAILDKRVVFGQAAQEMVQAIDQIADRTVAAAVTVPSVRW